MRGFLGLVGYYRKFLKDFAKKAGPLTTMLKKGCFKWSQESVVAIDDLKKALTTIPILALPNFDEQFIVECDASSTGLGAVLLQNDRPIAYFSKALHGSHRSLSVYDKEL